MGEVRLPKPRMFCVLLASSILTACGQGNLGGASTGDPHGAPTIDELARTTFAGISDHPVTLDDGRWEGEPVVENGASRPTVGLIRHFRLTGDLDGDGRDEAVVLLWESSGGSGTRIFLASAGRRGSKVESLATALIGDRAQIRAGRVAGDRVILDLIEAGPGDAACCPTQKTTKTWELGAEGLALVSTEITGTLSVADLQGPEWVLAELGRDRPVADGEEITLGFEDDRAAGAGGCNRYFGSVNSSTPGELRFSGMGATRMACPELAMDLEQRYLSALAGATSYSFLAGRLVLSCDTEDGPVALVFTELVP